MKITIETTVAASLDDVWNAWVEPRHIVQWNFASEEWHCPAAEIDLRPGGSFSYRMEARDGSTGFDFAGLFTAIEPRREIRYTLGDEREVAVVFSESNNAVRVIETFTAENELAAEQQRRGWQCILDNFKLHVESGLD